MTALVERTEMNNVQPMRSFALLCLCVVAGIGCGTSSKKVTIGGDCVLNTDMGAKTGAPNCGALQ